MSVFQLQVVTPDKLFFDGEVERVIVRTIDGDMGILKNHANLVTPLDIGALKIRIDGSDRIAAITGGFMKVSKDKTVIVSPACEWAQDIDLDRALKAKENAESRLKSPSKGSDLDIARIKLRRAINRITISEKNG